MDLDRFVELPGTDDGRKVITLMADPSMTDATGQPAGFLSLVDKGANLRRFQAIKAGDLAPGQGPTSAPGTGDHPEGILDRFMSAMGSLVSKLRGTATKADETGPITFDAAVQAERLRRARWEATDALWDVIRNIMGSDLDDKVGAVRLALGQFSTMVLGLVSAQAVAKAEDVPELLAALEAPAETVTKAGRVISARNLATMRSAVDALAQASAALEALIASATPSTAAKATDSPLEDPDMDPTKIAQLATAAATEAVKAAKAAGLTDAAELARIGAAASTEVYKAAVMGPAQAAMPTDTLAEQMGQSGGMSGTAPDPHAAITRALGAVTALTTKLDGLVSKVDGIDAALNGKGEGDAREPGVLEIATKAAELAQATATVVRKIEGTPAAPRGAGDPPKPRETVTKADDATWDGSAFDFGTKPADQPAT